MLKTISVIVVLVAIVGLFIGLQPAFKPIDAQYSCRIEVDKSEKIEQALSNAIEDVSSRKFIVINTNVKYCAIDGHFLVEAYGIDKGKLLLLGK